MTVVLVLGAGGSDGGQFIDGALAELAASTRFRPEHAEAIIGTSIGAFRAAAIGPGSHPSSEVVRALVTLAGRRPTASFLDRSARRLRLWLGATGARFVPRSRPAPAWSTPSGPHHAGAAVVSMDLDRRRREVHRLVEFGDSATALASAVRASAAIPIAVGPVVLDGHAHGDGALWSATSSDLAAETRPTLVVVIAPMIPNSGGSPLARLHRRQLQAELAELPVRSSVLVICPPNGPRRVTRTAEAGAAAVRGHHFP